MKESMRVLLALIAAIILGVVIAALHDASLIRAADAIAPIGTLWVNGIRMTVIPLVVSLLITGVASVSDVRSIGWLGGRTLIIFVLLLIGVAAVITPVAMAIFAFLPSHGALQLPPGAVEAAKEISAEGQAQTFSAWLVSLLPANPIAAAAAGAMMPLILFTLLRVGDCALLRDIASDADAFLPRCERRDARPGPLDHPCGANRGIRAHSSTGHPCRRNAGGRDWLLCRHLLSCEHRRNAATLPRCSNRE